MNKHNYRIGLTTATVLISGLSLIYTFIMFPHHTYVIAGISLIFIITTTILIQNILSYTAENNRRTLLEIKEYIDRTSVQKNDTEAFQSQLKKATFLYTKQIAKTLSVLENNYTESQEALYKNLSAIYSAQNKSTKLMIKYDQSNTTKVISTLKEVRNQLNDTISHGFDQMNPDSTEVVTLLEDIVTYFKEQPQSMDSSLNLQLNHIIQELQSISDNFQMVQAPISSFSEPSTEEVSVAFPEDTDTPFETASTYEDEAFVPTFTVVGKEDSIPEEESATVSDSNKTLSDDEIAALFAQADPAPKKPEKTDKPEDTPITDNQIATEENPDKQLSPEEIAALFAEAEPTPKKEDPNKQLTPEEIAALFATIG